MAKIMLVDDAAFMRMMLKTTLTQAGYTDLVEAEDGAKAAIEKADEAYRLMAEGNCGKVAVTFPD